MRVCVINLYRALGGPRGKPGGLGCACVFPAVPCSNLAVGTNLAPISASSPYLPSLHGGRAGQKNTGKKSTEEQNRKKDLLQAPMPKPTPTRALSLQGHSSDTAILLTHVYPQCQCNRFWRIPPSRERKAAKASKASVAKEEREGKEEEEEGKAAGDGTSSSFSPLGPSITAAQRRNLSFSSSFCFCPPASLSFSLFLPQEDTRSVLRPSIRPLGRALAAAAAALQAQAIGLPLLLPPSYAPCLGFVPLPPGGETRGNGGRRGLL